LVVFIVRGPEKYQRRFRSTSSNGQAIRNLQISRPAESPSGSDIQKDALVSFAYNVGLDIDVDTKAEGLGDSTLLRKLNALDYDGAADEFVKWNKDNGKVVPGLSRRRLAERQRFKDII